LFFEGDKPDSLLKEKVNKLIDGTSVHIKFNIEPLNNFIMSDEKEALITTSKESGLGGKSFSLDKQQQPLGVLRRSYESDWKKAGD
jgi:hypothetical protein